MASCPNCGQPIASEARFCGSCGNAVTTSSAAGPVQGTNSGAAGTGWTQVTPPSAPAPNAGAASAGWTPVAPPSIAVPTPPPISNGFPATGGAPATNSVSGTGWTPAVSAPTPQPPANGTPDAGPMSSNVPAAPPLASSTSWTPASAPSASQGTSSTAGWTQVNASPAVAQAVPSSASSGLSSGQAAACAYLLGPITGVIFLMIDPYKQDRFVRFHAMQSIVYSIACIAFNIAWSIVVGILAHFSGWIGLLMFPIRVLITLGMFLLWLFAMYQAVNNRQFSIPVLGSIAAQQAK